AARVARSTVTGRTLPASGYMSRPGSGPAAVFGRVTQQRATPSSVFTSILVALVESIMTVLTMQRAVRHTNRFVHIAERILDDQTIFRLAQQKADARLVARVL